MKTLLEWLADHLAHERGRGRGELVVDQFGFILRSWLRWLQAGHGVVTPDRLRPVHLESWLRHLLAWRTPKGLPLKPATVNTRLSAARGFLRWLGKRGIVPVHLGDAIEYVREPRLLPKSILEHTEVRRLLTRIDTSCPTGIRDRAMLEVLYTTGIRANELVTLRLSSVDWDQATALVLGKGNKERVVPLGKTALRWLENYVKGVRPFWIRDVTENALWLTGRGQKIGYESLLKMVHRQARRGGLPETVTPHSFRRSCTTELIRSGANLWHVKELLGHESLETLEHYARLTINDLKKTHAKCHPREREQD